MEAPAGVALGKIWRMSVGLQTNGATVVHGRLLCNPHGHRHSRYGYRVGVDVRAQASRCCLSTYPQEAIRSAATPDAAALWRRRLFAYLAGLFEVDSSVAADYHELQVRQYGTLYGNFYGTHDRPSALRYLPPKAYNGRCRQSCAPALTAVK